MNRLFIAAANIAAFAFALSVVPLVSKAEPGDYWVGILPIESNCPASTFEVSFYLDSEDVSCGPSLPPLGAPCTGYSWQVEGFDSNWTEKTAHWTPGSGTSGKLLGGSGYRFKWCRVDGEKFMPLTTDPFNTSHAYSVLKLSANCPPGSHDRGIYIDTEDDDNNNKHSGNISPNKVDANATLHFCQFRSSSGSAAVRRSFPVFKDNLGASVSYGVLHDFDAAQPNWVMNKKYVYFNDEDEDNKSKYLEKPPATLLTLDPYATFTSMVQRYQGGTFFEFAQVR
jgi:hypothetical protein